MHPCHSYLRHGTAQNERASRLSQLLHSISHCTAAVVGSWSKVCVPPVPSTTTPTYVVTSAWIRLHSCAGAMHARDIRVHSRAMPGFPAGKCCISAAIRVPSPGQAGVSKTHTMRAHGTRDCAAGWQQCSPHASCRAGGAACCSSTHRHAPRLAPGATPNRACQPAQPALHVAAARPGRLRACQALCAPLPAAALQTDWPAQPTLRALDRPCAPSHSVRGAACGRCRTAFAPRSHHPLGHPSPHAPCPSSPAPPGRQRPPHRNVRGAGALLTGGGGCARSAAS
jgi:hypothetical protein